MHMPPTPLNSGAVALDKETSQSVAFSTCVENIYSDQCDGTCNVYATAVYKGWVTDGEHGSTSETRGCGELDKVGCAGAWRGCCCYWYT